MKTKKIKTLQLAKKTIAQLDPNNLQKIVGGDMNTIEVPCHSSRCDLY